MGQTYAASGKRNVYFIDTSDFHSRNISVNLLLTETHSEL